MGRKAGRKTDRQADAAQRRRRALVWPVIVSLLLAIASNIYLTHLYVEVHAATSASSVESFCSLGEGFNCVTVAASKYSAFRGIPVAVYGVEFFGLALLVVALSSFSLWRVRAWDSLVFGMMLVGLPVSALLAWIALSKINSLCLLCSIVYGSNLLLLLLLGGVHRKRLGELLREGPRELLKQLGASNRMQAGTLVVVGLGISQLFWLPARFPSRPQHTMIDTTAMKNPWEAIRRQGLSAGNPAAKLRIEEFSDFECPSCANMHRRMFDVLKALGDRILLTHRDYPLDHACNRKIPRPFHETSCGAALHARCAGEQGKFWYYSSYLFDNQRAQTNDDLLRYAKAVKLDLAKLKACVKNPATRQALLDDIEEGIKRKIRGTPTLFVNGKEVTSPHAFEVSYWREQLKALGDGG